MVRLKVVIVEFAAAATFLFQFLNGAIKRFPQTGVRHFEHHFNSSMVRLKELQLL